MSRKPKRFQNNKEALDALKLELCFAIDLVINRQQLTYREAAFYLDTTPGTVSLVCNKHIELLTINQLFGYLSRICPNFRFMLSIDWSLSSATRVS